jgi:hypothetical protein
MMIFNVTLYLWESSLEEGREKGGNSKGNLLTDRKRERRRLIVKEAQIISILLCISIS